MPMTPPLDDDELGDDQNYKKILMQQLQAQMQPTPVDPNNNALISSLNQSFSKFGTLGGRSSDTSDVTRYADILDKSKAARQQQDMAKTGMQSQILQKLAMLKDKENQGANASALAMQRMEQDKAQKLADQKFDLQKQDRSFAQQKELQDMKTKQDLASAKVAKPTEGQSTSGYHASRMASAENTIEQIMKSGYNPAEYSASLRKTNIPFIGQVAATPQDRSFQQAAKEFIASVLRKETGASVSPKEFEEYSAIYFPSPGDDAQTIAQKADARKRATENMINMAGSAYDPSKQTSFAYTPPKAESGTAYADTPGATKSLEEMSDEELDAELARLKGK